MLIVGIISLSAYQVLNIYLYIPEVQLFYQLKTSMTRHFTTI